MSAVAVPMGAVHPLLAQLVARHGFAELTSATFDAWVAQPGHALVGFVEEPAKLKESLDLAVIAPQLARSAVRS